MNDALESRLRSDLATLDAVPLADPAAVHDAWRAAERRTARRRHIALAGASMALVVAVVAGMWWVQRPDGEAAPTATLAPPSSMAPDDRSDMDSSVQMIAPDPRGAVTPQAVVWTGDAAIVIADPDPQREPMPAAMRYEPATDRWTPVADPPWPAEVGIGGALAAWTGEEVVVVGEGTDAAYDPVADTWRVVPAASGAIGERSPWAWSGGELLVWPEEAAPTAYDPATDTWRTLPEPGVAHRRDAASVWTGHEWLIWGGDGLDGNALADGVAYDPSADTWRPLAPSPLSPRRVDGTWTGNEMVVVAGSFGGTPVAGGLHNGETALADGAAYDPATDTWRPLVFGPAHPGFESVWTGERLLAFAKGVVVIYDPTTDTWTDDCCVGGTGPVWTGDAVLMIANTGTTSGGMIYTPPRSAVDLGGMSPGNRD